VGELFLLNSSEHVGKLSFVAEREKEEQGTCASVRFRRRDVECESCTVSGGDGGCILRAISGIRVGRADGDDEVRC
jgi:hypothetical protein